MFDYLMSLDDLEVNIVDSSGRSPLLYLVAERFHEYFALELIKKGADIHLRDCQGFTILHMAARRPFDDNLSLGLLLIGKGVDVNAQADDGTTPLYQACACGNVEWIHMLLYYGACATIPSDEGSLPIAALSPSLPSEEQRELVELLFEHTFDSDQVVIKLATLVDSMCLDCCLFVRLLNITKELEYDIDDVQYLFARLPFLKAKHFSVFMKKFKNVMSDLVANFAPFVSLVRYRTTVDTSHIFNALLESDQIFDLVQSFDLKQPLSQLVITGRRSFTEEDITKIVLVMLTYGLTVTSTDLEKVYNQYGYCDLFKILLHMEIVIDGIDHSSMAVFYYKPIVSLEEVSNALLLSSRLLKYYNHPQLQNLCAKPLPSMPSLVELSRNAARKLIVMRYNTKNSMQFYTILNWLPIGKMTKSIIALETELY